MVKRIIVAALAACAIVVAFGACSKNTKPLVSPVASATSNTATPSDPHAATGAIVPAGVGHKAKVLDVLQAGEYSYIQVEENGKQFWVATVQAKAAKGDTIEFADSPVFPSFQSKVLNRTFDNLMMVDGIRNDSKK